MPPQGLTALGEDDSHVRSLSPHIVVAWLKQNSTRPQERIATLSDGHQQQDLAV
jgi:hypothetical protein